MGKISPVAEQAFRELRVANSVLLRAMAREKRVRSMQVEAQRSLQVAMRNVKLLLQAVQPELSLGAPLDFEQARTVGEVVSAAGAVEGELS